MVFVRACATSLAFFLFLWPGSLQAQTNPSRWLQGYQETVSGGTIWYHSPQPDVRNALLVRSLDERDFIEWRSAPIPLDIKREYVTFIWIFGMDVDLDSHTYSLYINNQKWFRFANPKTSSTKEITVKGPENSELRFRVTLIDRHDDVFGYASMRLPARSFPPGEALNLKVVGETAGSRVWYMTFQSPLQESLTIFPQQALIRKDGLLWQPVHLDVVRLGNPLKATISANEIEDVETVLKFGFNRIVLYFPEVKRERNRSINIKMERRSSISKAFIQTPIREWFVYLVQHTHTDIGYTRPQTEILAEHIRFIDYALDYCDLTDDYPDAARFRWTCESSWGVREYLNTRPPDQIERFLQRVLEGRIEVTGMIFNMSEIADENLYSASLLPVKQFKDLGIPVTTAMQNDVNGIAWCLADFFHEAGIKYLNMGQHGHRARIPFDKPTAFWWESASGKKVLAFRADHYMTGNNWGIHTGKFPVIERELMQYLKDLDEKKYSYNRIAVQYSGYHTDNSPPAIGGCDFIKEWNERYEWPKLRSATVREYLEYLESNHSEDLEKYRVAWPDWWSDGFGSAARETAAARIAQAELVASQGLLSMARLLGQKIPNSVSHRIQKINDALLFWDEHTLGAAESVSDPLVENTMVQWSEKAAYVWEAVKDTHLLQEAGMGLLQSLIPRSDVPTICVFNTLNWLRTGLVEVYIDHEIIPPGRAFKVVDKNGNKIAVQESRSRADGAYWNLWCKDIPPMGYKVYRIELARGRHENPDLTKLRNGIVENKFYRVKIDQTTGAISSLVDKKMHREVVDSQSPWLLGQFVHERISDRSQLELFRLHTYNRQPLVNIKVECGKDGPIWSSLFVSGESPTAEDGKPVVCEIRLFNTEKRLEFHYRITKRGITDPEAIYIAFPFRMPSGKTCYEIQGGLVYPGENQLEGTSADWHAVQNFVAVRGPDSQCILGSDEIPLVHCGDINLGKFQYIAQVSSPHVFSWVMNNYWVTNFRASQEGEFKWRYFLTSAKDKSNSYATRFSWNSRVPLLSRVFPPGDSIKAPFTQSLLTINSENILLVSAKPSQDGEGIILHLRETEGKPAELSVVLPFIESRKQALTEVNVIEEIIGETRESIRIKPWESKFVKLHLR
jgi:alpha-mannosidase